jgi:1,2-diacylglycerol 3-alpha-glucosyltransferase
LNIGIVTTWFERGAAYVSKAYKEALEKDHNIFIYARGGEEYAIGNSLWNTKEVTWGNKKVSSIPTVIDLTDFEKWLVKSKLDLVIFNEQHWWEPILLCNTLGILIGAYIDYYTEDTVPFFGSYDFLICNTMRHYSVFKWHPNCVYVPWGTNLELFKPKTFDLLSDRLTFFHSCGFNPKRKGTDILLHAFSKMNKPGKLIIHSQINLFEKIPDCAEIMIKLINTKKLEYIEQTVTAPGYFGLGDVYVYPARLDGLGLTVIEALASGLPVITTNSAPMNEFVVDGDNGQLVEVDRYVSRSDGYYWPQSYVCVEDLKDKMEWYIDNISSISAFKHNARDFAEEHLNWIENIKCLSMSISLFKKLPRNETQNVEEQIRKYERSRMPLELKYPISFKIASIMMIIMKNIKK